MPSLLPGENEVDGVGMGRKKMSTYASTRLRLSGQTGAIQTGGQKPAQVTWDETVDMS